MNEIAILFPLFTMGLISSAHCIGMCGGIMGALGMAIPTDAKAKRWLILFAYNIGRIASYTLMGMLAGFFAQQVVALIGGAGGLIILRVLAGVMLIAMGLYLANWWRGLTTLEVVGGYFWKFLQPLGKKLMPVTTVPKGLLLGAVWGWLPCGLVYSALAAAMTQPSPALAGSAMLSFGLGTLPAVLAAGVAAQQLTQLLQKTSLRRFLALVIILFGCWTIFAAVSHNHQHSGDMHDHQHMHEHMNMSSAASETSAEEGAVTHEHHHH